MEDLDQWINELTMDSNTVDGRNPAPVENGGKHPIILKGFQPSKVVQDFATINSRINDS
jgi:hypothetical protein